MLKKDQVFNCRHCNEEFGFKSHSYYHVFCDDACNQAHKQQKKEELFEERYNKWLNNEDLGLKSPRKLIRKFVMKRDGEKCDICSITEWQGKPLAFWMDHIDGDASNDDPKNCRILCLNCDSQQSTFGAKNTGKGRKTRGLPQYG